MNASTVQHPQHTDHETSNGVSSSPALDTPSAQTLAGAKYIELVHMIGRDLQYAPGWRGEAAKQLGISASLLSQILNGRKVTRSTVQKAIDSNAAPHKYFDTADVARMPETIPPPPSYTPPLAPAAVPPAPSFQTPSIKRVVDPLLVFDAYRALPKETRKQLLAFMIMLEQRENGDDIARLTAPPSHTPHKSS